MTMVAASNSLKFPASVAWRRSRRDQSSKSFVPSEGVFLNELLSLLCRGSRSRLDCPQSSELTSPVFPPTQAALVG